MSNYGVYTRCVEEVLDFARSGTILASRIAPNSHLHIIHSLEDVLIYRDPEIPNAEINCAMYWFEIKRVDQIKYRIALSHVPENVRLRLDEDCIFHSHAIVQSLTDMIGIHEAEDIANDMHVLALNRCACGVIDSFDERLFSIYKAGGYPCGWKGKYPDGQLVVFSR